VPGPIVVVANGQAGRLEAIPSFAPKVDADGGVEATVRDRDGKPGAALKIEVEPFDAREVAGERENSRRTGAPAASPRE
jgi:hypothetical protein